MKKNKVSERVAYLVFEYTRRRDNFKTVMHVYMTGDEEYVRGYNLANHIIQFLSKRDGSEQRLIVKGAKQKGDILIYRVVIEITNVHGDKALYTPREYIINRDRRYAAAIDYFREDINMMFSGSLRPMYASLKLVE